MTLDYLCPSCFLNGKMKWFFGKKAFADHFREKHRVFTRNHQEK